MEGEEDFYKKFRFGGINQFIDSCFPRRNWIIFFEIIERFFEVLWICQDSKICSMKGFIRLLIFQIILIVK